MNALHPRLDAIPDVQREFRLELRLVPSWFVMYGGTALVLRLDHRVIRPKAARRASMRTSPA